MAERPENLNILAEIGEEFVNIKLKPEQTLEQVLKTFYKVMRKHGIKQGIKTDNGITCSNPEWILCYYAFQQLVVDPYFMWANLGVFQNTPKDLRHY